MKEVDAILLVCGYPSLRLTNFRLVVHPRMHTAVSKVLESVADREEMHRPWIRNLFARFRMVSPAWRHTMAKQGFLPPT